MRKANYSPEVKKVIDSILLEYPQVVPGKMFGYPAYYINKRMFACVYEEGIGIKIPENLAEELVGREGITYFQPMGRRKMREWIQIERKNPEDYVKDIDIFISSMNFVASAGPK